MFTVFLLNKFIASSMAQQCATGHEFFGLRPWYFYLPDYDFHDPNNPNSCLIKHFNLLGTNGASDVPLVLLAVVDDLLRIAGLVAVGFVIYGAIRMIGSQGDPDGLSKAQDTIINALIGVVIAVVAVAFVSFLGNKLGG